MKNETNISDKPEKNVTINNSHNTIKSISSAA